MIKEQWTVNHADFVKWTEFTVYSKAYGKFYFLRLLAVADLFIAGLLYLTGVPLLICTLIFAIIFGAHAIFKPYFDRKVSRNLRRNIFNKSIKASFNEVDRFYELTDSALSAYKKGQELLSKSCGLILIGW